MKKVHVLIEDDNWKNLWAIVKKRYVSPVRKFHVVLNEAIREYIERHKDELEG